MQLKTCTLANSSFSRAGSSFCHNCIALISANADFMTVCDRIVASPIPSIFCPFLLVYFTSTVVRHRKRNGRRIMNNTNREGFGKRQSWHIQIINQSLTWRGLSHDTAEQLSLGPIRSALAGRRGT